MKIKPNASPSETTSSFYKSNEAFCSDFESYIASKNGKVKGNYNAWSYLVFGKISKPNKWNLLYKKATFTSTGNLFLSSKHQCLLVVAEWTMQTKNSSTFASDFVIRKKTKIDFLRKIISKSVSELDLSNKYILDIKDNKTQLISKLITILKSLFLSGEIYKIEHRNGKLKIEMRTEKHHFEIFDKLILEI